MGAGRGKYWLACGDIISTFYRLRVNIRARLRDPRLKKHLSALNSIALLTAFVG
jgi:hypothetical protein